MDNKRDFENSNLDIRFGFQTNVKRSDLESDWLKHIWTTNDQSRFDGASNSGVYGGQGNSHLRLLMAESDIQKEPEYQKGTDAYIQLKNMSRNIGGMLNTSGLSRYNPMINEDYVLEKRTSLDDRIEDFSLMKGGFTICNSQASLQGMDRTKPALEDLIHPMLNRHKSNDSFALTMTVRNSFNNTQINEEKNIPSSNTIKNSQVTITLV